jgi:hypothetical protein
MLPVADLDRSKAAARDELGGSYSSFASFSDPDGNRSAAGDHRAAARKGVTRRWAVTTT